MRPHRSALGPPGKDQGQPPLFPPTTFSSLADQAFQPASVLQASFDQHIHTLRFFTISQPLPIMATFAASPFVRSTARNELARPLVGYPAEALQVGQHFGSNGLTDVRFLTGGFEGWIIILTRGGAMELVAKSPQSSWPGAWVFYTDCSVIPGDLPGFSVVWPNVDSNGRANWDAKGYYAVGISGESISESDDTELFAICAALEEAYKKALMIIHSTQPVIWPPLITIYTDSQNALKNLADLSSTNQVTSTPTDDIVARICTASSNLRTVGITGPQIKLVWIPSHSGIAGNEVADQTAK